LVRLRCRDGQKRQNGAEDESLHSEFTLYKNEPSSLRPDYRRRTTSCLDGRFVASGDFLTVL
jgi:hypothetical protein